MKRNNTLAILAIVIMAALMITACGKSEFGATENTGKLMTINAQKAAKDDFFMIGSLEVADGEQIEIKSGIEEGVVKVEIIAAPEEQSAEEIPDMDGEPVITANIDVHNSFAGTLPAGSYMVKATCIEKATGTISIEVTPAP